MTTDFLTPHDWTALSSCSQPEHRQLFEDTQLCASASTSPAEKTLIAQAKKVCIFCPVARQCREDAFTTEAYLGGTERFGIRGGLTARERAKTAALDPYCARCRVRPTAKWQRVYHIRRLCRSCQLETQVDPLYRYFPDTPAPVDSELTA